MDSRLLRLGIVAGLFRLEEPGSAMELLETKLEMTKLSRSWRRDGLEIGFVPTMGALHEGHLYLMRRARQDCDRLVVSVFVNPLQFGAGEDLDAYPRDLENDARLAEKVGCDALFAPSVVEMYPHKVETKVTVEGPSQGLCGGSRPGHFDGVATVVAKLFNIVEPDRAYFGKKDAQQLAVVRKIVDDLDFPVSIVGCPTVREPDGLAYSSRNQYLKKEARTAAVCLFGGLLEAAKLLESGERRADRLEKAVASVVDAEPLARLDYAELRDSTTIDKLDRVPENGEAILAVAAYLSNPGKDAPAARLIDNVFILSKDGRVSIDKGVVISGFASLAENRVG